MKKLILFVAWIGFLGSDSFAQTKTPAQIVTELCTASLYPTGVNNYLSVQIVLAGHGATIDAGLPASFYGTAFSPIYSGNIVNLRVSSLNNLTYKALQFGDKWKYSTTLISDNLKNATFLMTLTNGMTTTQSTSIGNLKITYGNGTSKTINLPSSMVARGADLNSGYTLTGPVTGEFGTEQIIIIIKRGYLGG
jgi:hypothetical protein